MLFKVTGVEFHDLPVVGVGGLHADGLGDRQAAGWRRDHVHLVPGVQTQRQGQARGHAYLASLAGLPAPCHRHGVLALTV